VGHGKANSFFTINKVGIPQELGIEMTAEAINGITHDPATQHGASFGLQFDPSVKELSPFDHIEFNWNPHGHPPAGLFDQPHFDFHFYMITEAERDIIPPCDASTMKFHDSLPPSGFIPASYLPAPGGEAKMGKHWIDKNMLSPFTHTMIYGSYNGKANFLEPMVTKAFLESGQKVNVSYAQPTQFEHKNKYYPTIYNIYKDASTHKHYITLSGFVLR
jgi:hypothetical protein